MMLKAINPDGKWIVLQAIVRVTDNLTMEQKIISTRSKLYDGYLQMKRMALKSQRLNFTVAGYDGDPSFLPMEKNNLASFFWGWAKGRTLGDECWWSWTDADHAFRCDVLVSIFHPLRQVHYLHQQSSRISKLWTLHCGCGWKTWTGPCDILDGFDGLLVSLGWKKIKSWTVT